MFCENSNTSIHLHIAYGCCLAPTAKLSSCDTDHMLHSFCFAPLLLSLQNHSDSSNSMAFLMPCISLYHNIYFTTMTYHVKIRTKWTLTIAI